MDIDEKFLELFSMDDECYSRLESPWSEGKWTYASDGFILVSVRQLMGIEGANKFHIRIAGSELEKQLEAEGDWLPLPEIKAEGKCPVCDGSGESYQCPRCYDGSGDCMGDCPYCDGEGWVSREKAGMLAELGGETCRACYRAGMDLKNKVMRIGGVYFQARFIALLRGLPLPLISVRGEGRAARFTFDGGDGLLMPVRGDRTETWQVLPE